MNSAALGANKLKYPKTFPTLTSSTNQYFNPQWLAKVSIALGRDDNDCGLQTFSYKEKMQQKI